MSVLKYMGVRLFFIIYNSIVRIRTRKITIGFHAKVHPGAVFEGCNKIGNFASFKGRIGFGSYIGSNSSVMGVIGRYCSIADNVKFIDATHPVNTFVSTHPGFYSLKKQSGISFVKRQKFCERPLLNGEEVSFIIGNDVYIGYGSTILGPVRIGDGAIIAANSTVVEDVEPYSIVAGLPAKLKKKRFSEEEIKYLLKFKWWNKEIKWLKIHADEFEDIKIFMTKSGEC